MLKKINNSKSTLMTHTEGNTVKLMLAAVKFQTIQSLNTSLHFIICNFKTQHKKSNKCRQRQFDMVLTPNSKFHSTTTGSLEYYLSISRTLFGRCLYHDIRSKEAQPTKEQTQKQDHKHFIN